MSKDLLLSLAIVVLALAAPCSCAFGKTSNKIKSAVFLSPKIELGSGSVADKYYYDVDFPRGHVALKSFNAEVVDEFGNPVPLHETYLHHWVVARYHQPKLAAEANFDGHHRVLKEVYGYVVRNSGICQGDTLGQYFGLGSETRGTATDIPDPFGIEIGNPVEIPEGYEEKWMINVHAIDTRGVVDRMGCTECRRDLYNVTLDKHGKPLRPDYVGGLHVCHDNTQCKLKEGIQSLKRSIYLRYTVKWVDWDSSVVPVKIYILDVTDTLQRLDTLNGTSTTHDCKVEYDVEPCRTSQKDGNDCVLPHVKKTSLPMPKGGYVIYGVAHQHSGGTGTILYGQDGRVICTSLPSYGNGKEAGNEEDYIVGMTTCYPRPGSVKIIDGETVTMESNYSSGGRGHTGVMGLFYLMVAEQLPPPHIRPSARYFMGINNIFN